MAQRMPELGCIIQFEMHDFAQVVDELPGKIRMEVYTSVSNTIVDTVNIAVLSRGEEVTIPEFKAYFPEEHAVQAARALSLGSALCRSIVQLVLLSQNPLDDYKKVMLQYLRYFIDEETLRKSSFV